MDGGHPNVLSGPGPVTDEIMRTVISVSIVMGAAIMVEVEQPLETHSVNLLT